MFKTESDEISDAIGRAKEGEIAVQTHLSGLVKQLWRTLPPDDEAILHRLKEKIKTYRNTQLHHLSLYYEKELETYERFRFKYLRRFFGER